MRKTKKYLLQLTKITDRITSIFIFAAILSVIFFIGYEVIQLFQNILIINLSEFLHTLSVIIILVKAYRLLLFYLESHHVSIKYILEIAIIAPAVEIIFAVTERPIEYNILFAVFFAVSFTLYSVFYSKLRQTDDQYCKEFDTHEKY